VVSEVDSELTDADLAILFCLEMGYPLQPWQMTVMLKAIREAEG
jgi:hypothetical protein